MGHLTNQHIETVRAFLDKQGVSFQPLKEELLDHFLLDIESEMKSGSSFDEAFGHITQQLVKHQLLTIEQETMEAINKQTTLTTRFTYLALALLMLTTAFKLLHLPGTTLLLFTCIGAFTLSLLTGAITGIKRYKDKLGAGMLAAVIGSVILQIIAWAMIVLNQPSMSPLREISLAAIIVTFSIATYQFATNERYVNSILSYLHDKYRDGIERVLLIILGVASVLKISALVMGYPPNVAMVLLVFVIIGGVLHFFASQWQYKLSKKMAVLLISIFIIGMIPALGPSISYEVRAILASSFYAAIALIALHRSENTPIQQLSIYGAIGFYALFFLNTWQLLPVSLDAYLFNPFVFAVLIGLLVMNWNARLIKVFYITAIANYLLEYPLSLGFSF